MTDPSPKPRRRYIRFSLRGLMLFILVISVALGWTIHEARKQGIAVAALEKLGCRIECREYDSDEEATVLERLRKLLGEDKWGDVIYVGGDNSQLNDAGMIHFQALPRLIEAYLDDTAVSDAGLTYLQTTHLQTLWLCGTQVTGTGLVNMAELTQLGLNDMTVNDETLVQLQRLPKLATLYLDGT